MHLGISTGLAKMLGSTVLSGGGGAPVGDPNVNLVDSNGWVADYSSPPLEFDFENDPKFLITERSGFDTDASAVSVVETVPLMKRLRLPYSSQNSLTANLVSVADFIYAGEQVNAGAVTNNSSRQYPKPKAMWLNRQLERVRGSSVNVRLAVAHEFARNGAPVAAVRFAISDGASTVEALVNAVSTANFSVTGLSGCFYEADLDLTSLSEGMCSVDATIYPWVGNAFTISVDADTWPSANLCPLQILNDRAGGYGEAFAYVDPISGDDATGVVSANAATAMAAPYATVSASASAIQSFNIASYGRTSVSGGTVRLLEGTHIRERFTPVVTDIPLEIEAADPSKRATTIFTDGGISLNLSAPKKVVFRNLTLQKQGGNVIFMDANASYTNSEDSVCQFENVVFDMNGTANYNAWFYRSGLISCFGCENVVPSVTNIFGYKATSALVDCLAVGGTSAGTYNAFAVDDTEAAPNAVAPTANVRAGKGQFFGFCRFGSSRTNTALLRTFGPDLGARGFAIIGCILESYGTTGQPALQIHADGNADPVEGILVMANTIVGNRFNYGYLDNAGSPADKHITCRFNICHRVNTKSDVFALDGALTGNWSITHHVQHLSNAYIFGDNRGSAGPGVGAWVGEVFAPGEVTGTAGVPLAVDWVDDRSKDGTGTGGGDYTPGPAAVLPTIPVGLAPHPVDLYGRAIADNGSATIGALQPV